MSNMLRNNEQPLHNEGNATTLPIGVVVAHGSWQPLTRPPRRLWIPCSSCGYASINEDRALRGWEETVRSPKFYRCADCASADMPAGDAA